MLIGRNGQYFCMQSFWSSVRRTVSNQFAVFAMTFEYAATMHTSANNRWQNMRRISEKWKIKTKIILSKKKNQYRIKYVFYRIIPLSNSLPILTLENVINFKQSLWTAVHSHQSRQAIAGMCMCGAILFRSPCHLHTNSALQATYTHTHTSTPSRVHHFCAHDEFFNKFRHMALVWLSE